MRGIKFRAWNAENGEGFKMLYNVAVQDGKHVTPEQTNGCDYWDAVLVPNDNIVMQFTGLLDKNGKEIFEGDLLKAKSLVVKIFYDKGAFYFCKNLPILLNAMNQDLEIIGNIFENPELLEG